MYTPHSQWELHWKLYFLYNVHVPLSVDCECYAMFTYGYPGLWCVWMKIWIVSIVVMVSAVLLLLLLWLCSMLCCVPIHLLITPYISQYWCYVWVCTRKQRQPGMQEWRERSAVFWKWGMCLWTVQMYTTGNYWIVAMATMMPVYLSHCGYLPSCSLQMNFIQEKPVSVVTSIVQLTNQEKGVVVKKEGGRRREKLCGLVTSWLSVAPQVLRVIPTLSLLTGKGRCETSSGGSQVWESTRSPAGHMMFTWPVAVLIGVIIITLLYVHFPLKQENNNLWCLQLVCEYLNSIKLVYVKMHYKCMYSMYCAYECFSKSYHFLFI